MAGLVAEVSSFPEKCLADAGGGSVRDAGAVLARSSLVASVPALGVALAAGRVTGEHVDALARRLERLEPQTRARLLAADVGWAEAASVRSPERFSAFIGEQVRRVDRSDGEDRLAAQRRQVGLSWRPCSDGMHEWRLLLDPVSALKFDRQIASQVEALFRDSVPHGCPTNPLQRQAFLRAHGLLSLLDGGGGRVGRPEVIVVVDTRVDGGSDAGTDTGTEFDTDTDSEPDASSSRFASRCGSGPFVDWGLPVDVPSRILVELFGRADVHALIVRNGVVLHAGGELSLGRSTRLANKAQRRALRGLYATCAIPGCAARFDNCSVHHVRWWRHGGCTDLSNLLPVCSKHHHLVHEGGWSLTLQPNRSLAVNLPDGTVMSTGPPVRRAA